MIRKHKKYLRPRKMYESQRIADENALVEAYGLKNKREIWKTEAKVRYFRTRAHNMPINENSLMGYHLYSLLWRTDKTFTSNKA